MASSPGMASPALAQEASDGRVSGDAYDALVAMSREARAISMLLEAADHARDAIELEPSRARAYQLLGTALQAAGDVMGACGAYVQYMELEAQQDNEIFGVVTASAFNLLQQNACASVPRPSWWNEASLLELSERAVKLAPGLHYAWNMRGRVLTRMPPIKDVEWKERPAVEEIADLDEGGRCFDESAKLTQDPDYKEHYLRNVLGCRNVKPPMTASPEPASPSAMRTSLDGSSSSTTVSDEMRESAAHGAAV